jgi:hypothetical protein
MKEGRTKQRRRQKKEMTTTEYKESAHLRFSTRISETLSGFDVS